MIIVINVPFGFLQIQFDSVISSLTSSPLFHSDRKIMPLFIAMAAAATCSKWKDNFVFAAVNADVNAL